MARPLRIEYPGAFYHVMNRGQRQDAIFDDDCDRERFLSCLERMSRQFAVRIHAYCLMTNHYHLILETPQANLSRAMQWLNVSYAAYYNRRHGYAGHLFQGRYKAIVVEADEYLESLSRYIHLNPVRAEMVASPWEYPWSSCRFYAEPLQMPGWLYVDRLFAGFGKNRRAARKRYRTYVSESDPVDPFKEGLVGSLLGSVAFVDWAKSTFFADGRETREIPELKQLKPRPSVEAIVACVGQHFKVPSELIVKRGMKHNHARDVAIFLSRDVSGCSCQALGRIFGQVSGAAITMRYKYIEQAIVEDRKLRQVADKLRKRIMNI